MIPSLSERDSSRVIAALCAIVGPRHVLTGEDVSQRWDGYPPTNPMRALCIVRPATTQEVSAILSYCDGRGLKVVPQGGRTGLVGGARTSEDEIALSLERMRGIAPVDTHGATIVVEAGAPLQAVQEAARHADFYYPVDLGARGSATIGGTIATNAGGNSVLRYGMTREQILGLEVVLADGTILCSMNSLIKNNTGYDLKHWFVGSEGTLGVVTRAVLRLRPAPGSRAAAFVGLADFEAVLALLAHAMARADGALSSFEVMWPSFVECVTSHGARTLPLDGEHGFYVLMEIVSHRSDALLEELMASSWEDGIIADASIAQNDTQVDAFWALRDDIDALMGAMKPCFAYDVSLPQSAMASYVEQVQARIVERWPSGRLAVFGHIADGNLHLCVHAGGTGGHEEVDAMVYGPLRELGGSISAEHGIGVEKKGYLKVSRTSAEIEAMRWMKLALDPRGTLNPGKLLP